MRVLPPALKRLLARPADGENYAHEPCHDVVVVSATAEPLDWMLEEHRDLPQLVDRPGGWHQVVIWGDRFIACGVDYAVVTVVGRRDPALQFRAIVFPEDASSGRILSVIDPVIAWCPNGNEYHATFQGVTVSLYQQGPDGTLCSLHSPLLDRPWTLAINRDHDFATVPSRAAADFETVLELVARWTATQKARKNARPRV